MTLLDAAADHTLRTDLARLARARAFFAHRSVGADLVDGVVALAETTGEPVLRVSAVDCDLPGGVFGHAMLVANGDPRAKLRDLERMMASGIGQASRVVLFKFCYADFTERTDANEIFHAYTATLGSVRSTYRHLVFVHVTVPLVAVRRGTGAAAAIGRLVRGGRPGLAENDRREEFNDLVRRVYGGREPIFDLALLESTRPNGERELHRLQGRPVAALAPDYTRDGGHLNAAARAAIARQLVAAIATLAGAA